jgi:hypothetical protein
MRAIRAFAFLLLLSSAAFAREKDWQIWLDQSLGYDLTENSTLRADQSFRIKQDISRLETYTIQAGLQQHKWSWIEYGYYLRYMRDDVYGVAVNEIRPVFDLVLKWNWGKTRWDNRSRFEYRFRESRDDTFRYRNRQRLVLPWKLTPLDLKPYGAAELFLNPGDDTILVKNRLRAMVGIQTEPDGFIRKMELKSGRRFTSDIYLMYQQTESLNTLVNEYILGIKLGFFF